MIDIKEILVKATKQYDDATDENKIIAVKLIMTQLKNALVSNFPSRWEDIKDITIPIDYVNRK
jgi:hypothetical protein